MRIEQDAIGFTTRRRQIHLPFVVTPDDFPALIIIDQFGKRGACFFSWAKDGDQPLRVREGRVEFNGGDRFAPAIVG